MSNRQQALTLCQHAHQQVVSVYNGGDEDPLLLAQSVDLYMEALAVDPKYDEPYLGLAYLSFVSGNQEQALHLLNQAQLLNPINMRIGQLRQKILRSPSVSPVQLKRIKGLEHNQSKSNFDVAVLLDDKSPPQNEPTPIAEDMEAEPAPLAPMLQIHPDLGPANRPGKLSSGPEVILLQRLLQRLGFQVTTHGEYDAATLNALKNFQYRKNITISGLPDPKTRAFLNHILSKLPPDALQPESPETSTQSDEDLWEEMNMPQSFTLELGPAERVDKISSGPEVLLLQELLIQSQPALEITGVYDKATFAAVRNFQASQKLPVSGMVDAKTRPALNRALEQTLIENIIRVEFMQQIWRYRNEQGQSLSPLMGLQLNKWWQEVLHLARQMPPLATPLFEVPAFPERILISSVLSSPGQLGVVSQGVEVQRLQETLAQQGIPVESNGHFESNTFMAVKEFERRHQLPPTGVVQGETRQQVNQYLQQRYRHEEALEHLWSRIQNLQQLWQVPLSEETYHAISQLLVRLLTTTEFEPFSQELGPSNRLGKVSQGFEVSLLRWLLEQEGYAFENSEANFDTELYNALRKFQQQHQLPMTGLVDEKTRQVLNHLLHHWQTHELNSESFAPAPPA